MRALRLGLSGSAIALDPLRLVTLAREAESLGFHSFWCGESWGADSVVPVTWVAAHTSTIRVGSDIMQLQSRSPTLTANTAATLDVLSGGRMILGLGVSAPPVIEGWHGQPYTKPLVRTREYVEIVRSVFARRAPLEFHGELYDIPYTGPGATGLGKPMKSLIHPREDLPIYLAAIGPRNVALAAEIADGLLPIFWSPTNWRQAFGDALSGIDPDRFDIAPLVTVALGDDIDACRDHVRPQLALYIGGMGARRQNYYNGLACRYGYEGAAAKIQDLYLAGRRSEAAAAVPDSLVDEVAFVGPPGHVAEQVEAWRESPATTLILFTVDPAALRTLAELIL